MTEDTFNPEARDGDGDGIVQEGTPFERPVEEAEVNPVEEAAAEEVVEPVVEAVAVEDTTVITAPEPAEEAPAITAVNDGVIGTGKVTKKKEKPAPAKSRVSGEKTVALYASRNISWQGVGKLNLGYNLVSQSAADKWVTLEAVRLATPEEVKANLG